MKKLTEQIIELHQNYNDLGDDLLLLEAVRLAVNGGIPFPQEYINSCFQRIKDQIDQHAGDIRLLSEFLSSPQRLR